MCLNYVSAPHTITDLNRPIVHLVPTICFHTSFNYIRSGVDDADDPMGPHARGAFHPLRLPPGLPRGLSRLTALGLLVSEPHDLKVWIVYQV